MENVQSRIDTTAAYSAMIHQLPDEVTLLIIAFLSQLVNDDTSRAPRLEPSGVQALARLGQTCKRMKQIVEPQLYQTFTKDTNVKSPLYAYLSDDNHVHNLHDDDVNIHEDTNGTTTILEPNIQLRRFLRTLIERPDLARHVKHVSLRQWETVDSLAYFGLKTHPAGSIEARSYYMAISRLLLGSSSQPWVAAWLYALAEGVEDAEVALLLALTPNLEGLELEMPSVSWTGASLFLRKVVQQSRKGSLYTFDLTGSHSFARLRNVAILRGTTRDGMNPLALRLLSKLFDLPACQYSCV